MTDILKFNDAVEDEKIVLKFGTTRIGRYIRDPYTGDDIDLKTDREAALNTKKHLENPNVINFEKYMNRFLCSIPKENRWKFEYFLEVPFPNPDISLFNSLYQKFGDGSLMKRRFFRVDIYFPHFGVAIELDSEEHHADLNEALDHAKENLIYEHYGIKTILRINLASTKVWENKRRVRELYKTLKRLAANTPVDNRPVILFNTVVDSWNIVNSEILPFFPYIESCSSNYYTKHEHLYEEREVYLDYKSLPPVLKITIDNRGTIRTALENVYKRIKNVKLVIVRP